MDTTILQLISGVLHGESKNQTVDYGNREDQRNSFSNIPLQNQLDPAVRLLLDPSQAPPTFLEGSPGSYLAHLEQL